MEQPPHHELQQCVDVEKPLPPSTHNLVTVRMGTAKENEIAEPCYDDLRRYCQLDMPLPSIEEIKASEDLLSHPDVTTRVVRVSDGVVAKYSPVLDVEEAENLAYLSANSTVPVPRVFASFKEPGTDMLFIIMEYVRGSTLESCIKTLSPDEGLEIERLLKNILTDLRSLPSPGYIGAVGHKRCLDSFFYTPEACPAINGPFSTEQEMCEGILLRLQETECSAHIDFLRELMSCTLSKESDVVFTHGDLQPKNIMVDKVIESSGTTRIAVTIIDWEISGWYPSYWEFCMSAACGKYRGEWLQMTRRIMHHYTQEYLLMQMLRRTQFW